MKKHHLLLLLLSIIAIGLINADLAMAQPGLPGPPGQAPIDGGLGILAALGGSYAIKKLKNRTK